MKVYFVILVLVSCIFANEWTPKNLEQIRTIHLECCQQYSLSPEEVAKFIKNNDLPNKEPLRKYVVCTSEKIGIFSKDHGYNVDRMAKQFKVDLKEEEVRHDAEECIAKNYNVDEKVDVSVFKVHSCFMKTKAGKKL